LTWPSHKDAHAAADESLAAGLAAIGTTAAVDPDFDAATAIAEYQKQIDATHEKIDDAARSRRERLTARLAANNTKAPVSDERPLSPGGRGLHSFPFQLNLSYSVHRITQLNS